MTLSISNLCDHDLIKSWNMFCKKSEIEIACQKPKIEYIFCNSYTPGSGD